MRAFPQVWAAPSGASRGPPVWLAGWGLARVLQLLWSQKSRQSGDSKTQAQKEQSKKPAHAGHSTSPPRRLTGGRCTPTRHLLLRPSPRAPIYVSTYMGQMDAASASECEGIHGQVAHRAKGARRLSRCQQTSSDSSCVSAPSWHGPRDFAAVCADMCLFCFPCASINSAPTTALSACHARRKCRIASGSAGCTVWATMQQLSCPRNKAQHGARAAG